MLEGEAPLPAPPVFSEELIARCQSRNDYRPMLFEWYKYVGSLATVLSRVRRDSPALASMPAKNYAVLVGLINRCCRLMLANIELSHAGLFGETTAIIDRCIFESATKLAWLCANDQARFRQYMADGLKTELELRDNIKRNISARGTGPVRIEVRMLESIKRYVDSSGLTEDEIRSERKLPDLATMIEALGQERLQYVVGQKIGSHHIHGNWPSLITHYLDELNGEYTPRDHDSPTHVNQYVFTPIIVLSSLRRFVECVVQGTEEKTAFLDLIKSITEEIIKIDREVVGQDFERAEI